MKPMTTIFDVLSTVSAFGNSSVRLFYWSTHLSDVCNYTYQPKVRLQKTNGKKRSYHLAPSKRQRDRDVFITLLRFYVIRFASSRTR